MLIIIDSILNHNHIILLLKASCHVPNNDQIDKIHWKKFWNKQTWEENV